MAVMGEPDRPPALCGAPVLDTLGAFMAGQGILAALLHRERAGVGQRVDVSLLNGVLLAHAARLSIFMATGVEPGRWGSGHPYLVPFQAFQAIAATRMLVKQEHPRAGRFRTLDFPVRLSASPATIRTPAPDLGEHTDTVLGEAGMSLEEIQELRRLRVVA